ncbi:DUF881 domain-containing protein [Parenemella sanctibonifatiensis]|uniref:DUF881 domain-containing protein n=1 Tax=Parenemella sanctibonifatiensis TaxID=2016505 RepID=A0A255EI26_9ACTN|nr:DUF881 domain-containing protein [Parenemella sanctibonifatiensis]OYN91178.1 hypothetical protein CGZ91_06895 [Parenemella sanctibonifatiensis]
MTHEDPDQDNDRADGTAGDEETDSDAADATGTGHETATDNDTTEHSEPTPRDRLKQALLKPRATQLLIAVLLGALAFSLVAQIRGQDDTYEGTRRSDLIQILDGLTQESRRLESELNDLRRTRESLENSQDRARAARDEAQRRTDDLSILAGTAPAQGRGIRIVIHDPQAKISPALILNGIQELRDAGAEVIEINDSIRLVASSSITGSTGAVQVDGHDIGPDIVIEIIGDPATLEQGARFRGGLVSEIESEAVGGRVTIDQVQLLEIRSVVEPRPQVYASPGP